MCKLPTTIKCIDTNLAGNCPTNCRYYTTVDKRGYPRCSASQCVYPNLSGNCPGDCNYFYLEMPDD